MIPGFSALPMMIRGGVVVPAEPFSLSGSWETGAEGWVDATYGGNVVPAYNPSGARTGSYLLGGTSALPWYFDYTLPPEVARGLRITASVYHRSDGVSSTRSLSYRIGSGPFITLATVTNNTQTYAQLIGSFTNSSAQAVTIRLGLLNRGYLDDWSIIGEDETSIDPNVYVTFEDMTGFYGPGAVGYSKAGVLAEGSPPFGSVTNDQFFGSTLDVLIIAPELGFGMAGFTGDPANVTGITSVKVGSMTFTVESVDQDGDLTVAYFTVPPSTSFNPLEPYTLEFIK